MLSVNTKPAQSGRSKNRNGNSGGRKGWKSKRRPSPAGFQPPNRKFDEDQDEGSVGSGASDYDLSTFGPVDVDPTVTESEWLRSQGIDPDALDAGENEDQEQGSVVLSLAEVSYNRDIFAVNKAEREKFFKAANALWGEQAIAQEEKRKERKNQHRERERERHLSHSHSSNHRTHEKEREKEREREREREKPIEQDVVSTSTGSGGRGGSFGEREWERERGERMGSSSGRGRGERERERGEGVNPGRGRGGGRRPIRRGRGRGRNSTDFHHNFGDHGFHNAMTAVVYPEMDPVSQSHGLPPPPLSHAPEQAILLTKTVVNSASKGGVATAAPGTPPASKGTLNASARAYVPTGASVEGMNPNAPSFVPRSILAAT